jgi:hypothetical protein
MEELIELQRQIETENPITEKRYDEIFLYPKAVRDKIEDIAQAITWHIIDAKKKAGTYKEAAGYSGSKRNRR